jgi:hypothetical protein
MRRMLSRIFGSRPHTHRPARPKRASLHVEALEQRALMAVTSVNLDAGVLRVVSDSADDQIEIRETATIILLTSPGATAPAPSGDTITVKDLTRPTNNLPPFPRSEVKRIEVNMGDGDDHFVSDTTVPTTVQAGAGNDLVETGPADDDIFCGEGNDTVHANDGVDFVFGEGGNDVLFGDNGNDQLQGGAGVNSLFAGPGNDTLTGGDNLSANQLEGQDGDDTIISSSRNDLVGGGPGRDTLFVTAGTVAVQDVEDVTIATPHDQPQTDGFSCGPNSGSRFLRSYGIDVSYDALRRKVKAASLIFKAHLGTRPVTLRKVLSGFKSGLSLHTKSSLQDVIDRLASGKPVIPLIAPGRNTLHYVVLNGVDLDNQTIRYVNTNGFSGTWTYEEFDHRWNWVSEFKGFKGRVLRLVLKAAGLKTRTFLT